MKLCFSSLSQFRRFLAMQALGDNPLFAGNVNNWTESNSAQACWDVQTHIAHCKRRATKYGHIVTAISIRVSDTAQSDVFRLDVIVGTKPRG